MAPNLASTHLAPPGLWSMAVPLPLWGTAPMALPTMWLQVAPVAMWPASWPAPWPNIPSSAHPATAAAAPTAAGCYHAGGGEPCRRPPQTTSAEQTAVADSLARLQHPSVRHRSCDWARLVAPLPLACLQAVLRLLFNARLRHFRSRHVLALARALGPLSDARRIEAGRQAVRLLHLVRPVGGVSPGCARRAADERVRLLARAITLLSDEPEGRDQARLAASWADHLPVSALNSRAVVSLLDVTARWGADSWRLFAASLGAWMRLAGPHCPHVGQVLVAWRSHPGEEAAKLEVLAQVPTALRLRQLSPPQRLQLAQALFVAPVAVLRACAAPLVACIGQLGLDHDGQARVVRGLLRGPSPQLPQTIARLDARLPELCARLPGPPSARLIEAAAPLLARHRHAEDARMQAGLGDFLRLLWPPGAPLDDATDRRMAALVGAMAEHSSATLLTAWAALGEGQEGARRQPPPRDDTLACLTRLLALPADHLAHLGCLLASLRRWAGGPMGPELAEDLAGAVADAAAKLPAHEVPDFLAFAAPMCRAVVREDLPLLLEALADVPPWARENFTAVVGPLLAGQTPRLLLADLLAHCARGSHRLSGPALEERWQRRLERCRAFHDGEVVAEENVMDSARISRCDRAVRLLRAHVGAMESAACSAALAELALAVEGLEAAAAGSPSHQALQRRRGGDSQLNLARRLLHGDPPWPPGTPRAARHLWPGLLSRSSQLPSLTLSQGEKVGVDRLAAWVWRAVEGLGREDPQQRDVLLHSLAMALAQSVEDDGRVVCATGISQRLVAVLQGYLPELGCDPCTPRELLCELGREASLAAGDAWSPAQVAALRRAALAQADSIFGRGSPAAQAFVVDLEAWLRELTDAASMADPS